MTVREAGRNVLVELPEGSGAVSEDARLPPQYSQPQPQPRRDAAEPQARREAVEPPPRREAAEPQPEAGPGNGGEPRTADGIREVRRLFQSASNPPRWPMYIRQAKQFLRNVDASFDERKFGFASLVDLLRACQRDGLFRIERDRQGVMRVFPGNVMQRAAGDVEHGDDDNRGNVADEAMPTAENASPAWSAADTSGEAEVVDGDVVQEMNTTPPVVDGESSPAPAEATASPRGRSRGGRGRAKPRTDRKPHGEAKPATEGKGAQESRPAGEGRAARTKSTAEGKPGAGVKPKKTSAPRPRVPRVRARKETPVV